MCKKKDYNDIPISYCNKCLSLKIYILEGTDIDYCGKCGNSEIEMDHTSIWEEKYEKLYGRKFIK